MQNLLRLPAVMTATGQSRSTLYLRIKQRLMTPPVKLGERCAAWPEREVAALNAARISGKSDEEIRSLVVALEQQRANAT